MKLTEKQRAFCDYYIESLNATESYKKAYNCTNETTARTNGAKNLQKPSIKKYIDEQLQQMQSNRIADATEVLEYLTRIIRNEETEEAILTVNTGDFTSEVRRVQKEISAKDKIKAAELLGKRYGLYTEKIEADVNQVIFVGEDNLED
nr:MAG TPA: Terminase small subunit [Caudoviricetes sp.]